MLQKSSLLYNNSLQFPYSTNFQLKKIPSLSEFSRKTFLPTDIKKDTHL